MNFTSLVSDFHSFERSAARAAARAAASLGIIPPPATVEMPPDAQYLNDHKGTGTMIRTDTTDNPDGSVTARTTLPPAGEANKKGQHIVDLNTDIGRAVAGHTHHHKRGQDEHPNPKYHLTHLGMFQHPELIIKHLWDVTKGTAFYVAWNYNDFYQHFATWKGSYVDMLTNVQFMWRALVTGLLTVVLLEIFPLLESLGRLLWDIFHVIRMAFGLVERATEELFWFLSVIWNDTEEFIRRFW